MRLSALYFNPTLVQLECMLQQAAKPLQAYFNPTLVQLESNVVLTLTWLSVRFQSHIGAIRMNKKAHARHLKRYFNPTLVQLEWLCASALDKTLSVFQSHIGAIRIHVGKTHNP